TAYSKSFGLLHAELLHERLRRREQPRVDEELARVLARGLEPDQHGAVAVVVRRLEEDLRPRLEQERLLVEVALHDDRVRPRAQRGEELALHLQRRAPVARTLLDPGQVSGQLDDVLP